MKVRLQHATNSSSTHSVVLLDEGVNVDQELWYDDVYGWEEFILTEKEEKRRYLAAQLANQLYDLLPHKLVLSLASSVFSLDQPITKDVFVDHQSVFYFPRQFGKTHFDLEFMQEIAKWVDQERVAIFGGNDNNYDPTQVGFNNELNTESLGVNTVVRRENKKTWTLYDTKSGRLVTFQFPPDDEPVIYSRPLLVDINITNYCEKDCRFCYADSGTNGKAASIGTLQDIAYCLARLQVFEVALGGGEPLSRPDFTTVLSLFQSRGISANFTTRQYDWLFDDKRREEILSRANAFAISVKNKHEVVKVASAIHAHNLQGRFNFHIVMGVQTEYEFTRMIKAIDTFGLNVVLLGFKPVGRGEKFKPASYDNWLAVCNESGLYQVGIDTVLAQQFESQLKQIDREGLYVNYCEANNSMYIDAVGCGVAANSYDKKTTAFPKKLTADWLQARFQEFRSES